MEKEVEAVVGLGPRGLSADVPKHVRLAIAKSSALGAYKDACLLLAQNQVALMHSEIREIERQNRKIEASQEFKASNGLGYPYYRKPVLVHYFFEEIYGEGCWKDEDFVEDFLKHHPGLRIKVTRGTKGQEYVNGKGR